MGQRRTSERTKRVSETGEKCRAGRGLEPVAHDAGRPVALDTQTV